MKTGHGIVGILIYLSTLAPSFAQGFRGIPWKTSVAEVVRREGQPQSRNDQRSDQQINYFREVGDLGGRLTTFLFTNDKLDTGRYLLGDLTSDQINNLFDSLSEKYGPSKRYQSSFRWTTENTIIVLGNNPFGGQMLSHYEKAYFMRLGKEQKRQKKEGL